MKDTIPPRATLHAGVPPVGCGVGAPPTCGDELPKKTVASLRIWLSDSSRRIQALSSLISASSSLVRPSRSPASTSAWRTHRRTDSLPTPTLRAAAWHAAVNVGYSCRCSVTNRTARAFNSSSIFLGMSNILSTQKDAAQNPGRFKPGSHTPTLPNQRQVFSNPFHPATTSKSQVTALQSDSQNTSG